MNMNNVIDLDLGARIAGGKESVALEMLETLIAELPETKKAIVKAHQKSNFNALCEVVHKLHGGASYCGTPRLKEAAKNLEIAIRNTQTDAVKKLYQALINEIDAVLQLSRTANISRVKN